MLDIGQCVYLWRLERGIAQAELARRSGVPQPNLSNIEKGKADLTVSTLRNLAAALEVPAGDLVEGRSPQAGPSAVSSSRASLEKMARAVFDPNIPLNPAQKKIVSHLRQVRPRQTAGRTAKTDLHRAWIALRTQLAPEILRALLERVADQEQRAR